MNNNHHRLSDVYGVSRDIPLNYIERDSVDNNFIECLSADKHVIIYGSSKQGKTCLRKNSLLDKDYILVQCQNSWGLDKLAESILKEAGYTVEISTHKTVENRQKLLASFMASIPIIGGAKTDIGIDRSSASTVETHPLEIDPSDPNDLANALNSISFQKFIVLEDFHYLPKETQDQYAVFLKTIHERTKICFIIVAVWREENRLILVNGDLAGRVVSVDADAWSEAELKNVIAAGEKLLNIQFDDEFKSSLVGRSLGSVYIVQEACRLACEGSGILETQPDLRNIQSAENSEKYIEKVVHQSGPRYMSFLQNFSVGFQDTQLEMYKWILYPIITSSIQDLKSGIRYRYIRETLEKVHPKGRDLNPGNITQALLSVPALQAKKNIKPFVLDYDQTNLRLSVVDRGFLIWLSTQDRTELLYNLGISAD